MNIDTSLIPGFEGLTQEQKDAISNIQIPDETDLSGYVLKEVFDKKATEAANLSKQLKAKTDEARALMTEEQQKQAALAEAAEADQREKEELRNRIAELEKSNTLREYTMSFVGLGMEDKLSSETAAAMADGDSAKVFANLKKFLESYKKSIEAELMSKTPQPDGAGSGSQSAEDPALAFVRRRAAAHADAAKQAEEVRKSFLN